MKSPPTCTLTGRTSLHSSAGCLIGCFLFCPDAGRCDGDLASAQWQCTASGMLHTVSILQRVTFRREEDLTHTTISASFLPGRGRCEDDLTHKLAEIIRANNSLRKQEQNGAPQHIINDFAQLVQCYMCVCACVRACVLCVCMCVCVRACERVPPSAYCTN
eukprot:1160914-Pelagomonas_calceolata.AAC.3